MKLPTNAPELGKDPRGWTEAIKAATDPVLAEFLRRANHEYWHWDQLRWRPRPNATPYEEIWKAVKLSRRPQMRPFGLISTSGRPFAFWLPDSAQRDLHEIDLNLGGHIGIDLPGLTDRDRRKYLINSLMEEAIASSQIEGAATTRDVAKAMLRENRRPRTRGEQMIFNNYATISRLAGSRKRPLSLEMLLEIQASLTVDTLDDASGGGRLRTEADRVSIVDVRDETVLHTPPPARELPQRVEALCRFANGRDDTGFIHPVVRAILLHFWLAYDHPFIDGNGRTARALFYWYMLRSGYWLFEFLPISRIINRAPIKYGRAYLYSELDDCDATYFIMFNLRAIRLALHDLRKYLRHVQQERQRARELAVLFDGLNERQLQWVRQMADRPLSVSIAAYQRMHGISYATAYADLRTLTQRGVVQRRKGIGRQWLFSPSAKVKQRMRLRRAKPGPVD